VQAHQRARRVRAITCRASEATEAPEAAEAQRALRNQIRSTAHSSQGHVCDVNGLKAIGWYDGNNMSGLLLAMGEVPSLNTGGPCHGVARNI